MSWLAYVDESIRTDDGVYVLAAVALDRADAAAVRAAVRALEPRPGRRFHWRDRLPAARHSAAGLLAGLPTLAIAVVGAPVNPRRQERARRHCLGALLFELADAGVDEVCLESRNPVADRRDLDVVGGFRVRGVVPPTLRVAHARAGDEPLLWAADIVAGAICAAEGKEPAYREAVAAILTEHRIGLTRKREAEVRVYPRGPRPTSDPTAEGPASGSG
ncbi:hypothetical protein [Jiangella alba]|uniref:DUF3800 domain-containing protein n=1 Tax=Jiangella alba TaxID=561176 RepID=A0A1H5LTH8_9ACTN|nr:hypothetical protein [Jiangella alba]SEE80346.1 hypothetical protein SAMN04488561_2760 [Jiangella alba]